MTTVAFIEEGAFLSSQRQHVSQSWESGSTALKSLDTRLEAAIEGMLLSPKDSQPACNHLLQENESGAVFMSCNSSGDNSLGDINTNSLGDINTNYAVVG